MVEYQENEMLTNEFDSLDNIGWYPGHMAKAKRFIAANMSLVDMVVEIRERQLLHMLEDFVPHLILHSDAHHMAVILHTVRAYHFYCINSYQDAEPDKDRF